MFRILVLVALLPATALAQGASQTFAEAFPDGVPDTTGIDPSIFIGAPLLSNEEKYELTKAPQFQFQPTDLMVIGGSDVKPAQEWSATDVAACEASGGEVLPLSAGRKMCMRF